jgi:hypothetical protein
MDCDRLSSLIDRHNPGPGPLAIRPPLTEPECRWFLRAVDAGIVGFRACAGDCGRNKEPTRARIDEFVTIDGGLRHLLAFSGNDPGLSREYIPHIAAYAYAILGAGYDVKRSAFSKYRSFQRDVITRRRGTWYETDGEFYDSAERIWLHLEAKRDDAKVERIARQLDARGDLRALPTGVAKEVEYVLDLAPRYLWLVGPGSIDPPLHVWAVSVEGETATFDRVEGLPPAP